VPGAGSGVNPNAYGSLVQNNTYNIQGATSLQVQRVVDANAKKVNNAVNRAIATPGNWFNNQVGLF
jgi:hypothetical protein